MTFFLPAPVPRVKLCGFTSESDAAAALDAGADALGINFWPGSKRFVPPDNASPWLGRLAGRICRVGLFVEPDLDQIAATVDLGVLDALQLHGVTDPDFVEDTMSYGLPVILALAMGPDGPTQDPGRFPTRWMLLDTHVPGAFGGTGRTFDWAAFSRVAAAHPDRRFLLAGGLTPENVRAAIRATAPHLHAVDTASGVESSPGVKDAGRMRAFVDAVRSPANPD
jgi:phosphoribosylanthranilate isomerase